MDGQTSHDTRFDILFHKDWYTLDEVAYLLGQPKSTIASAAMSHQLKAMIVDHDIISIRRSDLLAWLNHGAFGWDLP